MRTDLIKFDHVLIISEFQVLMLILVEKSDADLLGDDLSSDVVFGRQTETHLK